MYTEGNILYFKPFYFKNGNTPKNKYFVVLKVTEQSLLVASLPSSQDHIPAHIVQKTGCIEIPDCNINCFIFLPDEPVTTCNKPFPLPTYIYGSQLDFYELAEMQNTYPLEGVHYELFGKMRPDLFHKLLYCLKHSNSVRLKFTRLLRV